MRRLLLQIPEIYNCEFSAIHGTNPPSFSELMTYYTAMRSYVEHEDGLINSRLTWSLTVHGFLLASFGLLFSKSTEMFSDFNRTGAAPANPNMHGLQIAFLCFAQLLVAALGAFVGWSSRGAIRAAHFALQHICSLTHAGAPLDLAPPPNKLTLGVKVGMQTATPVSMENITAGTRVAVDPDHVMREIVEVTSATTTNFVASFKHPHQPNAKVRALGWALLPKIVAGGDRGEHTGPARLYYLDLPTVAVVLWVCLAVLSSLLGGFAAIPGARERVLTIGKPSLSVTPPVNTPRFP